jgi:moderate conductance mechanosensitive channel
MWRRLFLDPQADWQLVAFIVVPTLLVALVASRVARRAAAAAMGHMLRDTLDTKSSLVRAPLRLIGFATFALVFTVLVFPAFEMADLHPRIGLHPRTLSTWMFGSGLRVLLVAAVAFAIIRIVAVGVKRFEHDVNFGTGLDAMERVKRARTLGSVLTNITTVVVLVIATLMILNEFNVNISPALTGAGIVGVALGFGSQTLVRDVIGGFFLILENQIRVGDSAAINGIGGSVEAINLRTTVLRDEEGTVHVIPNGAITTLANKSLHFSYYVVNLPLAYGEDTDQAAEVLKGIADHMQVEDDFKEFMLEPMEVIGVDSFEEHTVRLKVRLKTAPQKQWFVGREFRRRINKALRERGIGMWSPQRTIELGSARDNSATPNSARPNSSTPNSSTPK